MDVEMLFESIRSRIDKDAIDAFKGVFIILIVLGHVTLFSSTGSGLGRFLYSFHVFSFLILPFFYQHKNLSARWLIDRFFRYLTPYFFFVTFGAILFFLLYRRSDPVVSVFSDYFRALVVGSAFFLDISTGFQLFWFLPALFSLTVLIFLRSIPNLGRVWLFFLMLLHLFVGELDADLKKSFPFGVLIAIYIAPLAVVAIWILDRFRFGLKALGGGAGLVFFALVFLMLEVNSAVNLAKLELYGWRQFHLMVLHDAIAVSGFVFGLVLSVWYKKYSFLRNLGGASLAIYLVHSFIYQGLLMVANRLEVVPVGVNGKVLLGVVFSFLTVFLAYIVARYLFQATWIARLVFPDGGRLVDKWLFRGN